MENNSACRSVVGCQMTPWVFDNNYCLNLAGGGKEKNFLLKTKLTINNKQ